MFDWIPVELYTSLHYHVLLLVMLIILAHAFVYDVSDQQSIQFFQVLGGILTFLLVLYMGQRQISGRYFGDTYNYDKAYKLLQSGESIKIEKDFLFNYMMVYSSKIMDIHGFLQLCVVLYIVPCYFFSKKYFGNYWFFAMFMFMVSYSFWAYGVNGVRNGLATSLFLLALCLYHRKWLMYALLIMSYFMHASLVIPIAAFVVSGLYKNPKAYLAIWLLAIPLSLAGGSAWSSFFANLGFAEDRTQGYLTGGSEEYNDQFSQSGFRWDFLAYSASAVFAGWYFIFKKKITDKFYIHLFGTYCIANAFWILVINAAFSNRFAYLSWFLMPAVIAYPMFRYKLWDNQYRVFGIILFLYFMFTYIMNVML
ncbi:EpsG family protein [Chryseobacterium sp. POL2]|uniref:EpsG family protein n=1 Tax=Chryseobacterium sp. POL2 TaxID=2713414 RepID=UPI0013E1B31D|nr:EpsG family protein [Chryseobacterium sp. POL2]QIG90343.1 EpsG family protein [Chryseobacterium sp. POL2]